MLICGIMFAVLYYVKYSTMGHSGSYWKGVGGALALGYIVSGIVLTPLFKLQKVK